MKFNKKIVMVSAAALMIVAPVFPMGQNLATTVNATDTQAENGQL